MMGHFMKGSTVLSLVIMISFQVPGADADRKAQKQAVPAIFVFGDGLLDVGNNNYLPLGDAPRADHPYYGIDFHNSKPTGRFSNGYNMADFIAMAMGFEMSPPAYLSLTSPIKMEAGFTGVNYASADAGILSNLPFDEWPIPLLKQVDNFAAGTIGQMQDNLGKEKLSKLLSKSFFLISVGSRDLFYIYLLLRFPSRANETDPQHLVSSYGAVVTSLYKMGARKFGIINIPPFGCSPFGIKFGRGVCNDTMNNLAREFNDGLKSLLAGLSRNLRGLRYSIADFYAFSNATFMNPSAHGFLNTYSACCQNPCTPSLGPYEYSPPPCGNRTKYWFWDDTSITEQAAKLSAATFYDGPAKFTVPINFKQLINKL